jgi:hypothetical protein
MTAPQVTREEAIRRAALVLIGGVQLRASMTPRAAAEAAWYPGHRLGSVEAIERLITERRARSAGQPAA